MMVGSSYTCVTECHVVVALAACTLRAIWSGIFCGHLSCKGGFADSTVRLYDLRRMGSAEAGSDGGIGTSAVPEDGRHGDGGCVTLQGHSGPVFGVDYSADGQLLFSGSADGCGSMARCSPSYRQNSRAA